MEKTIVLYSDEFFYYHSINTIESFRRVDSNFKFIYFQINFERPVYISNMDVEVVSIRKKINLPSMTLWKPTVLKEALHMVEDFIYVDSDIIVSKNFRYETFINPIKEKPYGCRLHQTDWQYPVYWKFVNGIRYEYNEKPLMEILQVPGRTQSWVTTLSLGVNKDCLGFIEKWEEICMNGKYLFPEEKERDFRYYFQLGDETVYNVLLWKAGEKGYFEKNLIVEPKEISTIYKIENEEIINEQIEADNSLTYIEDSKKIHIYHQLKNLDFRIKVLEKLKYGK